MADFPHLPEPDEPWALGSETEQERRKALLKLPHMEPLATHVALIRHEQGLNGEVPDFDPLDGGTRARALFLLQDPGRKAVVSGFISRNNPDQTARNMCMLQRQAGLRREETLLWNIVPWRVRGKGPSPTDVDAGFGYFRRLLSLLPSLQAIVLVGRMAQSRLEDIRLMSPAVVECCPHTSPQNFNTRPYMRTEALAVFQRVAALLDDRGE